MAVRVLWNVGWTGSYEPIKRMQIPAEVPELRNCMCSGAEFLTRANAGCRAGSIFVGV